MAATDTNSMVELTADDRRLSEVERTDPKDFRVAGPRPELPLEIQPGSDCNGVVTGRRLGNLPERQLSDFLSGSNRHKPDLHRLPI